MQKIAEFFKTLRNPTRREIDQILKNLTKKEYFIFIGFFFLLLASVLMILWNINNLFAVEVPGAGGTVTEGMVGSPRFINPVLALTETDKDVTSLVFSGLLKKEPNGQIVPDLAQKYEVSKDGLIYTFTIRENAFFHDRQRVRADDVVFTINLAKDSLLKSPKKVNWEGVNVKKVDDTTVEFILRQPYASFLDNLTMGIIPEHVWKNIPIEQVSFSDMNINAVGSGPFQIEKIAKERSGAVSMVSLSSFNKFSGGESHIRNIVLRFYTSENDLVRAIENGSVDQAGTISPQNALQLKSKGYEIRTAVLPRIFGLFFNQNQAAIFTDKNIIEALDLAINKERIVNEVLQGYGKVIDSPIPASFYAGESLSEEPGIAEEVPESSPEKAGEILDKAGWKMGENGLREKEKTVNKKKEKTPLTFALATSDAPELQRVAELIKEDLGRIGVDVTLQIFEIGDLNQNIIRPRKYDALLFGQVINHEADLFAFWHSSQRNDPGLNIALFTNTKADKLLESAITSLDEKERLTKYTQLAEEIKKDKSVIFLYSPQFVYVVDPRLKGLRLDHIANSQDRFNGVNEWYKETEKLWKVFVK
jgi:peptide/nickel transport system substrate-binding protein